MTELQPSVASLIRAHDYLKSVSYRQRYTLNGVCHCPEQSDEEAQAILLRHYCQRLMEPNTTSSGC